MLKNDKIVLIRLRMYFPSFICWDTQYIPLKDSMSRLLTGNGGALINNLTQQFGYQKARLIFFSMDYKL